MGVAACQSLPPAVTGITVFPSDAQGTPQGDAMSYTQARPPIPLIGVRPGSDPAQTPMFLNRPSTGEVAVTLARGVQNFVLYTAWAGSSDRFVIAIYLDHESTPALSAVVSGDPSQPAVASQAAAAMGLEGEPVPNRSSVSAVRDGYRVVLQRAAFPLPVSRIDSVNAWGLQPDNIADVLGLITLAVDKVGG